MSPAAAAAPEPRLLLSWAAVPAVVLLLIGSSQMSPTRLGALSGLGEGQVATLVNVVQYAPALLLAAWALAGRRGTAGMGPWAAISGILVLSATWSIAPVTSLRAGLLTALTGLVAAGAARLPVRSWLTAAHGAMTIVVMAGLVADRLVADSRYDPVIGVFDTRNEFARHCAFALVLAVASLCASQGRVARSAAALGVVAATWGLWVAGSATAVVAVAVAAGAAFLPVVVRRTSLTTRVVVLSSCGPLLGALAVTQAPALLALLGRDGTLTGRTQIWALAADAVTARPALGYGADAFWTSMFGDRLRWSFGQSAVHAHNAWIDLVLSLGVLGGSVVVTLLLVLVVQSLGRGPALPGGQTHLLAALLGLQLSYSLSESALVRPMFSVTLITLVVLLQHGDERRRA